MGVCVVIAMVAVRQGGGISACCGLIRKEGRRAMQHGGEGDVHGLRWR